MAASFWLTTTFFLAHRANQISRRKADGNGGKSAKPDHHVFPGANHLPLWVVSNACSLRRAYETELVMTPISVNRSPGWRRKFRHCADASTHIAIARSRAKSADERHRILRFMGSDDAFLGLSSSETSRFEDWRAKI